MKKFQFICLFIIVSNVLCSQISVLIPSSPAISQTSVSDLNYWTCFQNPSAIGNLEHSEIGIQYESKYLLSQLSSKSFQLGLKNEFVNTGISFSHFGYSLYQEMMVGVGFGRNFAEKFSLGVQFDYYTAFFNASNSYRGVFFPQVGLQVRFTPNLILGFQTFNPFQTNILTEFVTKRLPSVFSLGTDYKFTPDLLWRTQIDKEVSSNYRFATGFEYNVFSEMNLKLGAYHLDYLVPCLGLGFKTGAFWFDLNCEIHPFLGLTTQAAIKYRFKK